jgi:SAM-dependent methyltransferase
VINSVLRSEAELQRAIHEIERNGWPIHPFRPKNWDCSIAINVVREIIRTGDSILDAGADRVSTFLPTLDHLGYTNLTGINLLEAQPERVGNIIYRHGDITNFHAASAGAFAFVACLSVIEDGVDIDSFMRESARILRPKGHLFVSTDFWCEAIDTRVASWSIFTPPAICGIARIAAEHGLRLTSDLNFECDERVCHHAGLEYTFMCLLFQRL